MPHSPVYNNAWLAARANRPTTITKDIMHSPEEQARRRALVDGPTFDTDPVEEARRYLESAPDYSDIASIPERLEELQSAPRPSLRALTEPLARAGQLAMTASLPTAFVPGGQAAAAGLGLGGTVAQVPDMLARSLDDDPTNDPGFLEGGFAALGLLPGIRAARSTRRAVPPTGMPSRVLGAPASTEVPFASAQRATDPNQVLRVAREVAGESGEPLNKVIRGKGGKTGYSKPQTEALMKLATSGMGGRRTIPLTVEQVAASPIPITENAFSALRHLATRTEKLPPPTMVPSVNAKFPYAGRSLTTAQERAQERFGRVYRSETGGPGTRTPPPEAPELGPEVELSPYLRAQDTLQRLRALARSRRTGQPLAEEF